MVALGEKSGDRTFHKNHECAGENAWKSIQNVLWNFTLKHKLLVVLEEKSTDQPSSSGEHNFTESCCQSILQMQRYYNGHVRTLNCW